MTVCKDLNDEEFIAHCRQNLNSLSIGALIEFEHREARLRPTAPDVAERVDSISAGMAERLKPMLDAIAADLQEKFKPFAEASAQLHDRFAAIGKIDLPKFDVPGLHPPKLDLLPKFDPLKSDLAKFDAPKLALLPKFDVPLFDPPQSFDSPEPPSLDRVDFSVIAERDKDANDAADAAATTVVVLADLYQLLEKSVATQEALNAQIETAGRTAHRLNVAIFIVALCTLLLGTSMAIW